MKPVTIGLDLAKNVFQVHGVDDRGVAVLRKRLSRTQVVPFFANLPPCLVGIEACGGAHFWTEKLQELGHTVKMMAPQFVKPYVKTNKNDMLDAEAICEAVSRPTMRFVAVKNAEQRSMLALHTARQGFVRARTAQANQIRGMMAEFGLVLPRGIQSMYEQVAAVIDDDLHPVPGRFKVLILRLLDHLHVLDQAAEDLHKEIVESHQKNEASRRLEAIPGIGPITASAIVASVGNASAFKSARQFAAWIGERAPRDWTGFERF
jgi:transposase